MKDGVLQMLHLVSGDILLSLSFIYQPWLLVTVLSALCALISPLANHRQWFIPPLRTI